MTTKFDICRVHTDRFRTMSSGKLNTALERFRGTGKWVRGEPRPIPVRKSWDTVNDFVRALINENDWRDISAQHHKTTDNPSSAAMYQRARKKSLEAEYAVWDAQMTAGCNITDREQIARDADREEHHDRARTIRKQRNLAARKRTHPRKR